MFTQSELRAIWLTADQEARKLHRKTFGANSQEEKTMLYAMNKATKEEWESIRDKAAKMFIEYDEHINPIDNGD